MCDTMVAVLPGRVLFAKNSDRDPNEAQFLDWQPRRRHPPGDRLRCTWIEVAQVRETHAVLLSRPFWMWGAEIGANEHGVVIGNEAVFTNEPYAKVGLTGMDLLRLALERAATAGDAVAVITELLAQYGQGGGCGHENRAFTYHNSFLIADSGGAYVLETAGRLWAVERVTSGARSISNGLTIGHFARQHSDRLKTTVSACRVRQPLTQGRAWGAHGPGDFMATLAAHGGAGTLAAHGGAGTLAAHGGAGTLAADGGAGTLAAHGSMAAHGTGTAVPRYSLVNGGMAAPCMHAGGLAANAQTTSSWVAEVTSAGATHWVTATAAPCTALFKPVAVGERLDLGPEPTDRYDSATLWWRHELLHRLAMRDPATALPVFAAERQTVQARWLATPPEPAQAFAEAGELLAKWTAAVAGTLGAQDRRPAWARRYWRRRNQRAGMPVARAA